MLVILMFAIIFETTFSTNVVKVPFNISTSDFATLLETDHFVDKTDLVKVMFESIEIKIVTAPRGFGKSTNMDMIKRFCEVTVDEKGNRVQTNLTSNYALFTRNNLNVYRYNREFFNNHFGNYTTIYLDFNQLSCSSYKSFISTFKVLIGKLYLSYKYLLHSHNLNEQEQYLFKQFYSTENIETLEDAELLNSAETLSRLLYTHFIRTRCIVLIDDYDAPVQKFIFHGGSGVDKIVHFIEHFISYLLKSNPYVERGLINACVRLSRVLSLSANNIVDFPFTKTHPFNEYYGLNETEIIHLAKKQGIQDSLPAIKEWYDGYWVGDGKFKIYNVFSIVSYLCSKQLKNYWAETDYSLKFEELCLHDEIYSKLMSALMYKTIEIVAIPIISKDNIIYLRNLVTSPENVEVNSRDANLFLNFMLDLGYFTIVETNSTRWSQIVFHFRNEDEVVYNVTISNREIRHKIRRSLHNLGFLRDKFKVSDSDIHSYIQSILKLGNQNSSYEEFGKAVLKLFNKSGFPENERQLQNPLVAFPWFYDEKFFLVKSEFKTEKRTFIDLLIIRKDLTGIIILLKNRKSSAQAQEGQTAYNALLDQIVKTNDTYNDVFNSFKEIKVKDRIFISLYLNDKGICSLSYLYNSIDISKAVDISIQ